MFALTWLLVGLPLLGAAVLLLGGRRTDRWGHWLGVIMSGGSFVVAVLIFFGMLGRSAEDRTITAAPLRLDRGRHLQRAVRPARRPAVDDLRAADHRRRHADPHLLRRLHEPRPRPPAVLRLPQPVRRRRCSLLVLADNYLLLYVGWEGVGLASYLLIGFWYFKRLRGGRVQEGLRRQPRRRRRALARAHAHVRHVRLGHLRRRPRRRRRARASRSSPASACCCCWRPAASRRSSRCSPGCSTRWRARPRSRPSSTRPRWSPPAST